jgi:hypothetical protein
MPPISDPIHDARASSPPLSIRWHPFPRLNCPSASSETPSTSDNELVAAATLTIAPPKPSASNFVVTDFGVPV